MESDLEARDDGSFARGAFFFAFVRALLMALVAFLLVAGVQRAIGKTSLAPAYNVADFRVLACGERAALDRRDPYLVEPLRACEHDLGLEPNEPSWAATPFCFPPYATALLAPFGVLSPHLGRLIWFVLSIAGTCVASAALALILARPAFGVALVLAPTLGLLNLHYGESVPLAVACVTLAGLALQRRAPMWAALAVACSTIEPEIALPAILGLLAFAPAARRTLVLALAGLGTLGIVAFGTARNLEYVTGFLAQHGRAEIASRDQYSVTHLVHLLGAPDRLASTIGVVAYAIVLAGGLVVARRLAPALGSSSAFVLVPLAISMLGGTFVHDVEIAAALPGALLVARDSRLGRVAVAFLAVDWNDTLRRALVPTLGAAAGIAITTLGGLPRARRALYATAYAAVVLGVFAALPQPAHYANAATAVPSPLPDLTDFSSIAWGWRIALTPSMHAVDLADLLRKIPTWLALGLVPLALRAARTGGVPAAYAMKPRRNPIDAA